MRLSNIDTTITIGSFKYSFDNVLDIDVADERGKSLKASPQGRGNGLLIESGLTSALKVTLTVFDIGIDDVNTFTNAFEEGERLSLDVIDTDDMECISGSKGIITTSPLARKIAEGDDAFNITLALNFTANNFAWKSL